MRTLADVVYLAHATFTVGMLLSWVVLPWQVVATICGGIALSNALDDGRCPVTRWEYRLRREALPIKGIATARPELYPLGAVVTYEGAEYVVKRKGYKQVRTAMMYLQPYLPSESVMARLLRVIGIHLTPAQVQRLMLTLLVVLPALAWVREYATR